MLLLALAGLFLFALRADAQQITGVDPQTAKAGDVVHAKGESLGPGSVDELYLTNAAQDVKIPIIEQTEKALTFKIPADLKRGRWALMIHIKAAAGTGLFEQPIKVMVE